MKTVKAAWVVGLLALGVQGCLPATSTPRDTSVGKAGYSDTAANFYGRDYMMCMRDARAHAVYVHESMREQAFGDMLGQCMYAHGWKAYAPVDAVEDPIPRYLGSGVH